MGVWGVARRLGHAGEEAIAAELTDLCAALGVDRAALWVAEGDEGRLELVASVGAQPAPGPSDAGPPLKVDGREVGLLALPPDDRWTSADPETSQRLERAAMVIERARLMDAERRFRLGAEHARRHLALLAEAGALLGAPHDDPDAALAAVVDIMVPAFADWCAVDVPDGLTVRRLAWAQGEHAGPSGPTERETQIRDRSRVHELHAAHPGWPATVLRTIASGQPELMAALGTATGFLAEDADHLALALDLGLDSCLLAPIRLRGLTVGVITCGTAPPRRGYRPSDVKAAEEVASRVAAAVERALLYRESQERAEQSGRRAAQLRRLMQAALAIHARHTVAGVLSVVAEQARRVMQAEACIAGLSEAYEPGGPHAIAWGEAPESARDEATLLERLRDAVSVAADGGLSGALSDTSGRTIGALVVVGSGGGGSRADDEPLLVSLAQMASVALESARLYERASASEARLRALVDASPMAIVELDPEGAVRQSNAAARVMFGWGEGPSGPSERGVQGPSGPSERGVQGPSGPSERGVQGPSGPSERGVQGPSGPSERGMQGGVDWRLPPLERDGRPIDTLSLVGSSAPSQTEVVLRGPDGPVDLSIATAPLRWSQAAPEATLVVVADVTERKRLEDQMSKARRMEAVGRTAGGVAHDLNNLLTVVLGHSQLLLRVMTGDDSGRESVEAIRMAGERAANLSTQLLTISRGHLVQPELVDVSATIASMEAVLRRLLPEELELDLTAGRSVGPVLVGRGHLEQVLLNLVVNARDAMAGGGRVSVTAFEEDGWVTLVVADTGQGMENDVLEHCFEPFVTTKQRPGSGLGLATVYGIVTQAGGAVTVTSTPGEDTRFTLRFPRATGEAEVAPARRREASPGGNERILLVEDDPAVRSLAREVLELEGYRVLEAASGDDALAAARAGVRYDMVLTDVAMPDMDGVEMVTRLADAHGSRPTLYVSGYVDDALGSPDSLPRGADFLAKPFAPAVLAAKVRQVLDETPRSSIG